jgi:hypothetical protein
MSYSTHMYLTEFDHENPAFIESLDETCRIFDGNFELLPDTGYWVREGKNYETFTDFMRREIISSSKQNGKRTVYMFINHDGENDEKVFKYFLAFGKILAKKMSAFIIIMTQIQTKDKDFLYFIHPDYGLSKFDKPDDEQYYNELERWEATADLKMHTEKAEECKKKLDNLNPIIQETNKQLDNPAPKESSDSLENLNKEIKKGNDENV